MTLSLAAAGLGVLLLAPSVEPAAVASPTPAPSTAAVATAAPETGPVAVPEPKLQAENLGNPRPGPNTWSAYPHPTTIGLYKPGQGYPKFDEAKAKVYYRKVCDKVRGLVADTIRRWDEAGL